VRRISRAATLRAIGREAEDLPPRHRGCALCGLVDGHPEGTEVIARGRHAVAVLARYALRRGHVLVVLRRHVERWSDLRWPEWQGLHRVAFRAVRALERALRPRRVFVAAFGSAVARATTFPHHHLHLVPVYRDDERDKPGSVFTWARGVLRPSASEARALAGLIRRAM
jgi:diadenosine tetraphosphate (Ap4A) HIT family hydrolase